MKDTDSDDFDPQSVYKKIPKNDLAAEKAAAAHVLDVYRSVMPKNADDIVTLQTSSPVLKVAESALLEIKLKGGRIDPALIGMLSNGAKLEDLLHEINKSGPEYDAKGLTSHQEIAHVMAVMADEIVTSGLVSIPVISRTRGVAL